MADLKLLTDRMMENKRSELQEGIQAAKQKAQENIQTANESLQEEKVSRKKRIELEQKAEYEKAKNALSNQKRNALLTEKQIALTAVFGAAKKQMEQLEPAQFQEFLMTVLTQFQQKEIELVFGEKSRSMVTDQFVKEWKQSGAQVRLSDETVAKKAGFVIRYEGIDHNYIFDALVEDVKDDVLPSLSQKLFQ